MPFCKFSTKDAELKLAVVLGLILSILSLLPYFLSTFSKGTFIQSAPSVINSSDANSQQSTMSVPESTPDTDTYWKYEDQLLKSVGNLFFKKMTPSNILLEDLYFTPSEFQDFSIYLDMPFNSPTCDQCELIVLVPSEPNSFRERSAIRDTWGSVAQGKPWPWVKIEMKVKLIFIIGIGSAFNTSYTFDNLTTNIVLMDKNSEKALFPIIYQNNIQGSKLLDQESQRQNSWSYIISQLLLEIDKYNDILLLDTVDTYRNLTRKILRSLKWTLENCPTAKYILKVDQDIFVNIPMIWTFTQHYGKRNSIYGCIYGKAKVLRGGRWNVSRSALPIDRYPIYASGNAYVLSVDAAKKIVEMATHFPYVPVEDAFITGILASVTKVDRISVEGFTRWTDRRPNSCKFVANKIYTGNNVDEDHKRIIWRHIHEKQALCK